MKKNTRTKAPRPGDAVNGTKSGRSDVGAVVCRVCRAPLSPDTRRRRSYCSDKCRLLAWAVDALGEALEAGRAEGLRERIARLGGELTIKVVHTDRDGRLPS